MTLAEVLEKTTDMSLLTDDELWEIRFALQYRLKQLENDLTFSEENSQDFHTKCLKDKYQTTKTALGKVKLLL